MNRPLTAFAFAWACLCLLSVSGAAERTVNESARSIPVAYDVDVVVVGGSSGGVAAAVEAANAGARVFVAAPRPYLGEDLCATYRLWLEPGETPTSPLGKALFCEPIERRRLPFTYTADQPSEYVHKDTDPPSVLGDGQWADAFKCSVQYNADTNVVLDLGKPRSFSEVRLMLFQSPKSFEVAEVVLSVSPDKKAWRPLAVLKNDKLGKGAYVRKSFQLAAAVRTRTRYVKCLFKKGPNAQRMLIGEILLVPAEEPGKGSPGLPMAVPMQVKRALDEALLAAKVPFLYGCYATDLLLDGDGRPAGIVMANRAGRQAVKAKVIIDATDRAWVARVAGARFRPYPSGPQQFTRIVVGGAPRGGQGVRARTIPIRSPIGGRAPISYGTGGWARKRNLLMAKEFGELIEYTLTIPMPDGSWPSFAEAEQIARKRTFHPEQVHEAEVLFQVPPDPVYARKSGSGDWPGADRADLDWFRSAGVQRLWVLGGCADIPRAAAGKLLRPLEMLAMGRRIGRAAGAQAKSAPALARVHLAGKPARPVEAGDGREFLTGLRPGQRGLATVHAPARALPVIGEYDVVVVGGGTAGAPAGVAAARAGAGTVVVEYLHGLGGVSTVGLIGIYCAGYRKGFTEETEAGVRDLAAASYVVGKMEWWRREIRRPGGHIWFGALGVGALVNEGKVVGAIVATPQGRGVVLAKTVVDGTGSADVAAAAGAECMYTSGAHIALQGAGLPRWETGATYINTDWTYVDESDMVDVWSAFVVAKRQNAGAYDLGQLIDTRERRRIVGDHILSPLDIVNKRTFPDTVGISQGGRLDKHGFTVHPYYMIRNWRGGITYTPYRCMLPKGLDGILVTGLGVSAHVDAIPSIRMQPCMQNLGYAAGAAAAMAAKGNGYTRDIDIKALQKHLVANACLTPEVIEHKDSFPIPLPKVQAAVRTLTAKDYSGLAVILAQPDLSVPLMRQAHSSPSTSADGKVRCAHVLGMMRDRTGVDTLVAKVDSFTELDTERIDKYFPWVTWLDSYLIALGRTKDPRARRPILDKLQMLIDGKSRRSSHPRAIAMALEELGDPRAALPLAQLVKATRMADAVVTSIEATEGRARGKGGTTELILARVLYRLGDHEGLGQTILEAYAKDLRGHYARHAQAVLAGGRK